jgi:hypothetical protein
MMEPSKLVVNILNFSSCQKQHMGVCMEDDESGECENVKKY